MKNIFNILLITFILVISLNPNIDAQEKLTNQNTQQLIFKDGTYAVTKIENNNFTGTAWMKNLVVPHEPSKIYVASVTFEPNTRTNWHSHAKGQSLIVTEGIGYTQKWGKEIQNFKRTSLRRYL